MPIDGLIEVVLVQEMEIKHLMYAWMDSAIRWRQIQRCILRVFYMIADMFHSFLDRGNINQTARQYGPHPQYPSPIQTHLDSMVQYLPC